MKKFSAITTLMALVAWPASCAATYSIVVADDVQGWVGGAGASCVGALDVSVIYAAVPGVGALHAQALLNELNRDAGQRLLEAGVVPAEVITTLTHADFDSQFGDRQYGVVAVNQAAATFTGARTTRWAGGHTGAWMSYRYAVQGNILTGEAVVDQTEAGFQRDACDLPERLINALLAGRRNSQGDQRCTIQGVAADSAFVRVDGPEGPVIALSVSGTADDAVLALEREFQAWRDTHPCPVVIPDMSTERVEAPTDQDMASPGHPVEQPLPAMGEAPSSANAAGDGCWVQRRGASSQPWVVWMLAGMALVISACCRSNTRQNAGREQWTGCEKQ